MYALNETNHETLYGTTSKASTIPDGFSWQGLPPNKPASAGPVFEEGCLVLSESFAAPNDATDGLVQKLDGLRGSYLVDVQRIWEGYDGRWVQDAPLLLRFEHEDVVVCPQLNAPGITLWTGSLDTSRPIRAVSNATSEGKHINEWSCLQWLPYRRDNTLVGHQVTDLHVLSLIAMDELQRVADVTSLAEERTLLNKHILFTVGLDNGRTYTFINHQGNLVLYA